MVYISKKKNNLCTIKVIFNTHLYCIKYIKNIEYIYIYNEINVLKEEVFIC